MILAFSGDPFLVRRSARRAVAERADPGSELVELGEGTSPEEIARLARQSGLFGSAALLVDFDAAFVGQAGVKPRNDALKVLEDVPEDTLVAVMDAGATPARQKRYREIGSLSHQPTPRYGALRGWVDQEMKQQGVEAAPGVPALLADLFGEDLPAIAAEIEKLSVLGEHLDEDRVRALVNRPASRDAFDLVDAMTAGDEATAVAVARSLLDAGEAPPRILGALAWQFALVARARGLLEEEGEVPKSIAARALGVAPYPAGKALDLAARLDERALDAVFRTLVDTDLAIKTGRREPAWALANAAILLAGLFGRARAA